MNDVDLANDPNQGSKSIAESFEIQSDSLVQSVESLAFPEWPQVLDDAERTPSLFASTPQMTIDFQKVQELTTMRRSSRRDASVRRDVSTSSDATISIATTSSVISMHVDEDGNYPAGGFKLDRDAVKSLTNVRIKCKVFSNAEIEQSHQKTAASGATEVVREEAEEVVVSSKATNNAEPSQSTVNTKKNMSEVYVIDSSEEEADEPLTSSSESEEEIIYTPKHKRRAPIKSESESDEAPRRRKKSKRINRDDSDASEKSESSSDDDVVVLDDQDDADFEAPSSSKRVTRSSRQIATEAKKVRAVIDDDDDDDDFVAEEPQKKKPRRVKIDDSSEEDDSARKSDRDTDDENSKSNRKGVKTRKILTRDQLAQETINAEDAERERQQRLEKRQKEYNGIVVSETTSGEGFKLPKLTQVVLDEDRDAEKPMPVTVHPSLVKILMPHQAQGLKFMYDNAFESLDRVRKGDDGGGCILAHCMGLGKTLQIVSFVHTVLSHPVLVEEVPKILIIVPKNVVLNWRNEFDKWLSDENRLNPVTVYQLDMWKKDCDRLAVLKNWFTKEDPAVMICGYDLFRMLTQREEDRPVPKSRNGKIPKPPKLTRKQKEFKVLQKSFQKYLQSPGPDMVICDEGHKLKNDESLLSKTIMRIQTRRRICLTGTPLQNNLMEYHVMVNFVKPGLLGLKTEFANRFSNIIDRGRTSDATPAEVALMKRRCHILFERLKHVVQRRDISILKEELPPKLEYIVMVRMTPAQITLYNQFLSVVNREGGFRGARKRLLPDYHTFSRIWTHPYLLISHAREVERQRILKADDDDFIDDSDGSEELGSGSSNDDDLDETAVVRNGTRSSKRLGGQDASDCESPVEETGWWTECDGVTETDRENWALSNKLMLLVDIIKACERIGDKLLVFSQSLESLRIIKKMLQMLVKNDIWYTLGHENICHDKSWGWEEGLDYLVIDGSVQANVREDIQLTFNDRSNLRSRLLLISTRAGSLGTNLVSANRVVIFDACWNPSHDTQSLFRVYRIGQRKASYIYRFIGQGTMEERIYNRQVTKESTSLRVVDEHQIQRHFDLHDLAELYRFEPTPYTLGDELKMDPPKDRLLADLIRARPEAIVSYVPHETLFINQADEQLTEEERKSAWEDYEREKRGIVVPAANMGMGMNMNLNVGAMPMNLNVGGIPMNFSAGLNMALGIPSNLWTPNFHGVAIDPDSLKFVSSDPLFFTAVSCNYTLAEAAKFAYIKIALTKLITLTMPNSPVEVATRIQSIFINHRGNSTLALNMCLSLFHSMLPVLQKYPAATSAIANFKRHAPWLMIEPPPLVRHTPLSVNPSSDAAGGSGPLKP